MVICVVLEMGLSLRICRVVGTTVAASGLGLALRGQSENLTWCVSHHHFVVTQLNMFLFISIGDRIC